MEHQLRHIDLVAWQARRSREPQRPPLIALALAAAFALGAAVLALRFALAVDLPLPLLQVAFAVMTASGALLLAQGLAHLLLRLQGR